MTCAASSRTCCATGAGVHPAQADEAARQPYQHHEVLIRHPRLLYEQGFTISGARNRLTDVAPPRAEKPASAEARRLAGPDDSAAGEAPHPVAGTPFAAIDSLTLSAAQVRQELISIRGLLGP